MLSVVADENFSHRILRGVKLRVRNLDVIVAQNAAMRGASDPELLAWAADQRRVLLTHDRQTIPMYAFNRIRSNQAVPGVIVVSDTMPIGEAIEALTMYLVCGEPEEFENLVVFIP